MDQDLVAAVKDIVRLNDEDDYDWGDEESSEEDGGNEESGEESD